MCFSIFNPSFGTKEGARATHAQVCTQVRTHSWDRSHPASMPVLPWCGDAGRKCQGFLPCVPVGPTCGGVLGWGFFHFLYNGLLLVHPLEAKQAGTIQWQKETSFMMLIPLNSFLLLEIQVVFVRNLEADDEFICLSTGTHPKQDRGCVCKMPHFFLKFRHSSSVNWG